MRAKKSLSQNFLSDISIARKIVDFARIEGSDTVLEIGPGRGVLTFLLSERAKEVIAIELDRGLYDALSEKIRQRKVKNLRLIYGEAMRFDYSSLGRFKVVANIPYHITTPLIFKLLEHRDRLVSMTLTVQKEVAQRIVAIPGGKDYGVLSLMVQYYGSAEIGFIISRGAFRPVPKVDSACLHIEIYKKPKVEVKDEMCFLKLIKTAFSKRRKTLYNNLKAEYPDIKATLEALGIEPSRRAETLSMAEFASLADRLCGYLGIEPSSDMIR